MKPISDPLAKDIITLWSAACADTPARESVKIQDDCFTLTITGHPPTKQQILDISGVPDHAIVQHKADRTIWSWYTHANQIFGKSGRLAQRMTGYEMRPQQMQMAQVVQRAIEMNTPAVVEAGTGTGKSFAYAAPVMSMGKKLTIAAPTTALQMQLWRKDIPFLSEVFAGKTFAMLMGKSNYFCADKIWSSEHYKSSGDLALKVMSTPVVEWLRNTRTGNLQDYDGELTDEVRGFLIDDECTCAGCPLRPECFYYQAKGKAKVADVLITNHSLVCLNQMYPLAGLLPVNDVLVIDEAHQLPEYARNTIGATTSKKGLERLFTRIKNMCESINKSGKSLIVADLEELDASISHFTTEVWNSFANTKDSFQVKVESDTVFVEGLELVKRLRAVASVIWDGEHPPKESLEKRRAKLATTVNRTAETLLQFCIRTKPGHVRYIEVREDKMHSVPFDVNHFLSDMIHGVDDDGLPLAPFRCNGCTQDMREVGELYVLDGKGYCHKCIDEYDYAGDAPLMSVDDFLAMPPPEKAEKRTVILTSATIAAPTMEGFKLQCGIGDCLELQVGSPFNYREQMLMYIPSATVPDPKKDATQHQEFVLQEMKDHVTWSRGGAFLLFTSNKALNYVYEQLKGIFEKQGLLVLKQGDYSKGEIIKKFKESGNAVLFGTKSFWEGVDIAGDALRYIGIDKMPFDAPNPISEAQTEALKLYAKETLGYEGSKAEWYPFEALQVPNMIIDLKQGVGRLIRRKDDFGVCAIFDPRIRTAFYGKKSVMKALPPATVTDKDVLISAFFENSRGRIDIASMNDLSKVPELPF